MDTSPRNPGARLLGPNPHTTSGRPSRLGLISSLAIAVLLVSACSHVSVPGSRADDPAAASDPTASASSVPVGQAAAAEQTPLPRDYDLTLTASCADGLLRGPYRVSVREGQVTSAVGESGHVVDVSMLGFVPTLEALADAEQPGSVRVVLDGRGWPLRVESLAGGQSTVCYAVSDLSTPD